MATKKKSLFRRILKYIFIVFGVIVLFLAYFAWINLSGGNNNEEILASLPKKVTPKYTDQSKNWWKETSVYQIYPRSYKDSDGDGVGDLTGVINKLDYIQSLGFETIWLSPFFKSPQYDHGYDISDYLSVQPEYGDMAIVDSLIEEIHSRDLKVVFDMVLNHTSDQHPWFLESKSSKDNPKRDWYVWKDGKGENPPNNWKNILGSISGWTYEPDRDQYFYAAFMPKQPDLNMANPEVKAEIFRTVKFWLDKGVDGFRLDIFNFIFEDKDYPDNPKTMRLFPKMDEAKWVFEEHKYNFQQPEVIEFAKELRAILESYSGGRFMVGEVFGSHKHMRELLGENEMDGLNLVFLFNFLEEFELSADYFREKVEEYEAFYPAPMTPTYVFSNHDQLRSITRLGDDPKKADILAAFQMTMRGVPFVYQGEEIGMTTGTIPLTEAQDPLSKNWLKMPSWMRESVGILTNRDNCRTPMQWSNESSGGFSTSNNTWLPVQDNYKDINVAQQLTDKNSLLNMYQNLLTLRNQNSVFEKGNITFIDKKELPENVLGYVRKEGIKEVSIYLNFSENKQSFLNLTPENNKVLLKKRGVLKSKEIKLDAFGVIITSN